MEDKPAGGGTPTYDELAAMVAWIARHSPACPVCGGRGGPDGEATSHLGGCQLDALRVRLGARGI